MVFYQIKQYGKPVCNHTDEPMDTEADIKDISNSIVKKAKKAVINKKMVDGAFDVIVCKEDGEEIDSFLCNTSNRY